jgi:hemerythrin-like domain-containing protein
MNRALDFEKPIDALIACHREMLDQMARAERLAHELLVGGAPTYDLQAQEWIEIAAFFRSEMAEHTRDEEDGLFPLMVEQAPDCVERFTFDHRWIEQSEQIFLSRHDDLAASAPCVDSTRVREFALQALEIVGHYRRHIRMEEEDLFPVAQSVLNAEALTDLGSRMREIRDVEPTAIA